MKRRHQPANVPVAAYMLCLGVCAIVPVILVRSYFESYHPKVSKAAVLQNLDSGCYHEQSNSDIQQISALCARAAAVNRGDIPLLLLKDVLPLGNTAPPEPDEFGNPSNFTSLYQLCSSLILMKVFSSPPVAINVGARDGIGRDGNTDPTWPLFVHLGFKGVAIEGSSQFQHELESNMHKLGVKTVISMATPENIVPLILDNLEGRNAIDVLKVDIDGWDCKLLPAILGDRRLDPPKAVMVEYNVKFPPPVKMSLATCPQSEYRSCARYHLYGCSLQYMNDDVMVPAGYALAQVDWQNALYLRKDVLSLLHLQRSGVDVGVAYASGYSRRKGREQNFPWNRDIDHLLNMSAQDVFVGTHRYVSSGYHLQDGAVVIGCGNGSMLVSYQAAPSISGAAVGEC